MHSKAPFFKGVFLFYKMYIHNFFAYFFKISIVNINISDIIIYI